MNGTKRALLSVICCAACCLLPGGLAAAEAPDAPPATDAVPDASTQLVESPVEAPAEMAPPELSGSLLPGAAPWMKPQQASNCSDCDSSQGYCSGPGSCRNYCLSLVGEIGFCHFNCNCCVCPEVAGPPPDPVPGPGGCDPVCNCPSGLVFCRDVPSGQNCPQVNCI